MGERPEDSQNAPASGYRAYLEAYRRPQPDFVAFRVAPGEYFGVHTDVGQIEFTTPTGLSERMLDVNMMLALGIGGKLAPWTGLGPTTLVTHFDAPAPRADTIDLARFSRWVIATENALYVCNVFGGQNFLVAVYTITHRAFDDADACRAMVVEEVTLQYQWLAAAMPEPRLAASFVYYTPASVVPRLGNYVLSVLEGGPLNVPVVPERRSPGGAAEPFWDVDDAAAAHALSSLSRGHAYTGFCGPPTRYRARPA